MDLLCLDGFITPRTVCAGETYVKPRSGLHIEDLPGFSCPALSAVEPGKFLDATVFTNEKMRIAGQMILDRMRNYLEPYVKERGPKEAGTIGTWSEDAPLAGATTRRGVRVRVEGGPMVIPTVPRVWIKSSTTIADLVLKIKDGVTTTEQTVSVTADVETEVWLNYEGNAKTLDIYVEDVRFEPYTGSTEGTSYFASCSSCGGHGRYFGIAGGGLLGDTEVTALHGIRAEVVLLCSLDPVACVLLKRFRFAVLYQWGILVLEEWLATSRTNYFSIHSKDWARDTIDQWNTIELPRHMKTSAETLASFISQLDPDCLNCGTGASYTHGLP